MADFSSLSTVWQAYQAEDSFLPFYIPLTVWITTFLHTKVGSNDKKIEFHRWYTIHNLHNFGAIALGLTSMFFNDDAVFDERIPILWSISYFCVDLVDCAMRKDLTYSAHAVFCLVLGMANYQTPICRQLRMNSKATLCEISNPFLHLCKKTRRPEHVVLFAAVFTLCRIVWIPVLMRQLATAGLEYTDFRQGFLLGFYVLNWFWYSKILMIIYKAAVGSKEDDNEKEKKQA